jgi:hypothetical protein
MGGGGGEGDEDVGYYNARGEWRLYADLA